MMPAPEPRVDPHRHGELLAEHRPVVRSEAEHRGDHVVEHPRVEGVTSGSESTTPVTKPTCRPAANSRVIVCPGSF